MLDCALELVFMNVSMNRLSYIEADNEVHIFTNSEYQDWRKL
jgi:hypothetical protein